ncbi:Hypothetical predicted protein [Cloeon dipterum]|uniref:Uncharacterized protein n=1 Tax=Cloeon dipterum TaxID=197152 RepID=A0A8S1DBB3_9INSE|nr:Hypothetical predicted protein [Cloeon dipterum]
MRAQLVFLALFCGMAFSSELFEGYKLIMTRPLKKGDLDKFDVFLHDPQIIFLKHPKIENLATAMVHPSRVAELKSRLHHGGVETLTIFEDVSKVVYPIKPTAPPEKRKIRRERITQESDRKLHHLAGEYKWFYFRH